MNDELKKVRVFYKKTNQEMATALGISKPYYWQLENGKRRLSYDLAVRIAHVFGKTPDQIFLSTQLTNGEHLADGIQDMQSPDEKLVYPESGSICIDKMGKVGGVSTC